jgi:hypothetical protein
VLPVASCAYLFTMGLLRCAHCGAAMSPHTSTSGHEAYVCSSRKQKSAAACVQTNIPRALLDSAVFEFFKAERFDADATRAELESKVTATHKQRAELLAAAVKDETKARENLERMRRQVKDGDITPAEWRDDWKPELDGELQAATAKREAMEQSTAAAAADAARIADLASSAAIKGLAAVQAQIAGKGCGQQTGSTL